MAREGFVVYHEMLKWLEPYGDAERGRILTAMLTYSLTGEAPGLSGNERFIWPAIREKIDRDKNAYDESCKRNKRNIQKRYDRVPDDTTVYDRIPNVPTETETGTETGTESCKKKEKKEKARFVPPTVEEVAVYCRERNNRIDPEAFIDFYTQKDWKVGKDKMVDWKAAVRTWEHRQKKDAAEKRRPETNNIFAQIYEEEYG